MQSVSEALSVARGCVSRGESKGRCSNCVEEVERRTYPPSVGSTRSRDAKKTPLRGARGRECLKTGGLSEE